MNENINIRIIGNPAAYPATATAEIESKNILLSLLNARFIKGEIRTMDKYPNSDGILDITDNEQLPIGKIDIQLKTLSPSNYNSPRFQCERNYFVYCQNSTLPTILIAVDRHNKKAYWRHIDKPTLEEVFEKMKGESYSLTLPVENCIDGVNEEYVSAWTQKAREVFEKVWNHDFLKEQKKQLEAKVTDLDSKLQTPIRLPVADLKDIHRFMDAYNYILDIEFGAAKQILYPDYWKIGIGILRYEHGNIQYLLYPVEFRKEQTLVKEVKPGDYEDIMRSMYERDVLLLANLNSRNDIRDLPLSYAYSLLESDILGVAGKYSFPIQDNFIAHEYLISFIDRYHAYLDMEVDLDSYALKELKYKLYSVLPMLVATGKNFADWVVDHNEDIDSYHGWQFSDNRKKKLIESIKKLNEGFVPKVKVTITSRLYNIDLITNYINWLEKNGITKAIRQYQTGQFNDKMYGVESWKTWNKEVLWSNTKLFVQHFHKLYDKYICAHLPYIKDFLKIVANEDTTIVYLFHFADDHKSTPHMEVYYLRPAKPKKGEIFCMLVEDPNNPINRKKYFIEEKYDCVFNEEEYQIIRMNAQSLDFMFEISPTYALINDKLSDKLKSFFAKKRREQN